MNTFPDITYFRITDIFVTDVLTRYFWLVLLFSFYFIAKKIINKDYQSHIPWTPKSSFLFIGFVIFVEHFLLFLFRIIGKAVGGQLGYYISPYNIASRDMQGILFMFLILCFLFLMVKFRYKQPLSILGLEKNRFSLGILWAISVSLLYCWIVLVNHKYSFDLNPDSYLQAAQYRLNMPIILASLVFAPITEEFVLRGYAYQALRKNLPFFVAAVFSSLLFVISHAYFAEKAYILGTFIVGLLAAFLFHKTGSLISCIMFHLSVNFIRLITVYNKGYILEAISWNYLKIAGFIVFFACVLLIKFASNKKKPLDYIQSE